MNEKSHKTTEHDRPRFDPAVDLFTLSICLDGPSVSKMSDAWSCSMKWERLCAFVCCVNTLLVVVTSLAKPLVVSDLIKCLLSASSSPKPSPNAAVMNNSKNMAAECLMWECCCILSASKCVSVCVCVRLLLDEQKNVFSQMRLFICRCYHRQALCVFLSTFK